MSIFLPKNTEQFNIAIFTGVNVLKVDSKEILILYFWGSFMVWKPNVKITYKPKPMPNVWDTNVRCPN